MIGFVFRGLRSGGIFVKPITGKGLGRAVGGGNWVCFAKGRIQEPGVRSQESGGRSRESGEEGRRQQTGERQRLQEEQETREGQESVHRTPWGGDRIR